MWHWGLFIYNGEKMNDRIIDNFNRAWVNHTADIYAGRFNDNCPVIFVPAAGNIRIFDVFRCCIPDFGGYIKNEGIMI